MLSVSTLLSSLGALLVLHSAYSALHYRAILLSVADVPDHLSPDQPPADVVLEVLLGFSLCLVGQLAGNTFVGVRATTAGGKRVSQTAPAYRTRDFDIFVTRAAGIAKAQRGKSA